MKYALPIVTFCCVAASQPAQADLYRCDSGHGTYIYTNIPCTHTQQPAGAEAGQHGDGMLVDPDTLRKPQKQASAIATRRTVRTAPKAKSRPAQVASVSPVDADAAQQEIVSAALPASMQAGGATQALKKFTLDDYRPGMSWLIHNEGQLMAYERYEITAVDEYRIHWRKTLLNADQQPFAGGISEDFVLNRDDRPALQAPVTNIRAAHYIFECQKQQLDQAVLWHVARLPLIVPYAEYRSGDKSVLVEIDVAE